MIKEGVERMIELSIDETLDILIQILSEEKSLNSLSFRILWSVLIGLIKRKMTKDEQGRKRWDDLWMDRFLGIKRRNWESDFYWDGGNPGTVRMKFLFCF